MERRASEGVSAGGTWYVLPTAFTTDGDLDLGSQERLVEAVIDWDVRGLALMGVMSEFASLTEAERTALLRVIFEVVADRVPVVVGCSAGSPAVVGARAGEAATLGAAAVMVSAPTLARDPESLPSFFAAVAASTDLPVVVQDEPAATGTPMPPSVLIRCLEASRSLVAKVEDPPTPVKIARLLRLEPSLCLYGGLGGMTCLWDLEAGARGTMTGFSFPEVLAAIRERHEAGQADEARRLFDRYLPLLVYEAQPVIGLHVRKLNLCRRGVLDSPATRSPAPKESSVRSQLDSIFERVGIAPGPDRIEIVTPSIDRA